MYTLVQNVVQFVNFLSYARSIKNIFFDKRDFAAQGFLIFRGRTSARAINTVLVTSHTYPSRHVLVKRVLICEISLLLRIFPCRGIEVLCFAKYDLMTHGMTC